MEQCGTEIFLQYNNSYNNNVGRVEDDWSAEDWQVYRDADLTLYFLKSSMCDKNVR